MLKIIFSKDKREFSRLLIQLCAVVTGVIVFLLTLTAAAYLEAAPVYQDTLRLHIRAASDSEEDQALKLLVRDRLTGLTAELTEGAENAEQAAEMVSANLARVCREAEVVLMENGCDAEVTAAVEKEFFNTRSYPIADDSPAGEGELTMPAGEYTALVVTIGEGTGHNWWCVLYPSLCLPAATAEQQADALSDFSESEQQLVLGEYRFGFWLLEAAARVQAWLEGESLHER